MNLTEKDSSGEWYRRFSDGDAAAIEDLAVRCRESLTLFIHGYVNDITCAEDIAADAFARLIAHGKQFRGEASVKTYLFTIGRNLALHHLKRRRREQALSYGDIGTAATGSCEPPEISFLREERRLVLYQAMQRLKPEYRDILFLLYFEGMSYAEAGTALKRTETQIANLAYRAKASLKKKLESEGFEYEEP